MMRALCFLGVLSTIAVLPPAAGQDQRLPLSLQEGQTFAFTVQMNRSPMLLLPPLPDAPIEVRAPDRPKETGAGSAPTIERYRLSVKQSTPGGDATLELDVRADSAVAGTRPMRFACNVHPEVTSDSAGPCKTCGLPLVLVGIGGESATFAVTVGSRGEIKSVTGAPAAPLPAGPAAKEGEEARPGDAGQPPPSGIVEAEVRNNLQAIFAAGIHDVDLETGRVYVLESAAGAEGPAVNPTAPTWHPVHLRFEEATSEGSDRLARFTIVSTTPAAGDEARKAGQKAAPATPDARGQAIYRFDDGLLQELTINHGPSERAAAGSDSVPAWIHIKRSAAGTTPR